MRVLSKFVVTFVMVAFIGAVSSVSYAAATGEAKVTEAGENTIAKIQEALTLVEKGGDKAEIIKAINEARQIQKDFRYETTERQRERANNILRAARDAYSKDDLQIGETKLREALAAYQEIKAIYDSKH
jgi:large subunit ribosomal protein L7/L12